MSTDSTLTRTLARFASQTRNEALPVEGVRAVHRAFMDSIGVALAGAGHPATQTVVDTLEELGASGPATVIGHDRSVDLASASLANGVMVHVLDWDDTVLPTRLHPSATLVPALLATGEARDLTGRDLVVPFAVGFESQARLAHAISPEMPQRGWHGTGVVGGVGVAAAVGRLLGLDEERMIHALGTAATGGAGLVATFGSMSKALNLGRAAAIGVQSAHLAGRGFTSHPDLLGAGRFLEMYDDSPRYDELTAGLCERWWVTANGFKPYPCGVVAHAAIDAVRELRAEAPPRESLERLALTVSPETGRLMGNPEPRTGLEAKFSVRYAAAVAWLHGDVLPHAFEDDSVTAPDCLRVLERVEVQASDAVHQHEAIARLETESGWTGTSHMTHARGTTTRPMTDDELRAKFRAASRAGGSRGVELLQTLDDFETTRIRDLTRLLGRDHSRQR